jgi:hypothetical protein
MSSGPVGLDVREYTYSIYSSVVGAGTALSVDGRKSWWITKIQVYTAAAGATVSLSFVKGSGGYAVVVAPNSCLVLEPNGAHKGGVNLSGAAGALLIIEYWFQTQEGQFSPSILVDTIP